MEKKRRPRIIKPGSGLPLEERPKQFTPGSEPEENNASDDFSEQKPWQDRPRYSEPPQRPYEKEQTDRTEGDSQDTPYTPPPPHRPYDSDYPRPYDRDRDRSSGYNERSAYDDRPRRWETDRPRYENRDDDRYNRPNDEGYDRRSQWNNRDDRPPRYGDDRGGGGYNRDRYPQDRPPRYGDDRGGGGYNRDRYPQDRPPRYGDDRGGGGYNRDRYPQDRPPRYGDDRGGGGYNRDRYPQDRPPRYGDDRGGGGYNRDRYPQDRPPRYGDDRGSGYGQQRPYQRRDDRSGGGGYGGGGRQGFGRKPMNKRPMQRRDEFYVERKPKPELPSGEGMPLNKYLAHCGIASRRKAVEFIEQGLVTVNGEVRTEPYYRIQQSDQVTCDGKPVQIQERLVYVLLNKPKGVITTTEDDRGRATVLDIVDPHFPERIYPVGRLDRDTTGLIVLTNDGDLAQKLSHPSYNIHKQYRVGLDRPLTHHDYERIEAGLELEDGMVTVNWIRFSEDHPTRDVVELEIVIGRNRVVRRLFEYLGYQVRKLDRFYYAGLTKKELPRGSFRELTQREIIMLKHFTGHPSANVKRYKSPTGESEEELMNETAPDFEPMPFEEPFEERQMEMEQDDITNAGQKENMDARHNENQLPLDETKDADVE